MHSFDISFEVPHHVCVYIYLTNCIYAFHYYSQYAYASSTDTTDLTDIYCFREFAYLCVNH